MTLGDIIKDYRVKHELSMDEFSKISGISKAYISLLEKNKHPKTGKAIAPSIQCIKQAADGMNMDFNVLFSKIDGDVTVNETKNNLPYYINDDAREMAQFMFENPEYKVLFDASRKVSKEDIDTVKAIMDKFKSQD